ncbi:MAG: ROK family protein [Patescibacteria group bacterium]|nr:ROK family protein [Patescibacteria group bacterium]
MYKIGFDIGGSSVKAAVLESDKVIKTTARDITYVDKTEKLVNVLEDFYQKLTQEPGKGKVEKVGFSVAGALDKEREKMLNSVNLSYLNNQPLRRLFSEAVGDLPVALENDANCFLVMEMKIGLARRFSNVYYVTIGTGVGGAMMIDKKLVVGAHGACGEPGHMIIDREKGLDLEELASNKFLKRKLGTASLEARKKAAAGDKRALEIFEELGANLGIGITNVINIVDPEAVIIGGGVALAREFFEPRMRQKIEELVTSPAARQTKIIFNTDKKLCRFGGAVGAALM